MPMVRCKPAAGRFPTPRVPGANMGDLYHIDADGLQAYPRCESWNCCQFSLHCHLTAGDTLFDIMKASFRSSLLSVYCNSVTELPWMLWNDLFQGLVYRGGFLRSIFFHEGLLVLVWLLWQFRLIADARFANANCDFFVNFQKHCYVLTFFVGYQLEGQFFGSLKFRRFSIKLCSLKTE